MNPVQVIARKRDGQTLTEAEIADFVAGYVASKCRAVDATLGCYTDDVIGGRHSTSVPGTWTRALSRGHLTLPSHQWLEDCYQLESAFRAAMGKRFYPHPGVKNIY